MTTHPDAALAALARAAAGLPRPLAQAWPERPVRVVIPFPPGGTLDTVGRMLAQKLGKTSSARPSSSRTGPAATA